jgi:two-component system chemotaxis response regulator CheB
MLAPTRVLVVDDSPSVCRLLTALLRSAADLHVVGVAHSGERAVEMADVLKPDVVTLDLDMPGIGGLGALERLMATRPTPVVLLSGVGRKAVTATAAGLSLGAVDFLPKYTAGRNTNPGELKAALVSKVRAAARVKVIRTVPRAKAASAQPTTDRVLVIGASTGGPAAVRTLLSGLPAKGRPAVVVVQHLPPQWTGPLATMLARHLRCEVRQATASDTVRPGVILVAGGDRHLTFKSDGGLSLTDGPKVNGYRPSIDVTMESAAAVYGRRAIGVVLTGMGEDGARGLLAVRRAGGRTFAQAAASCVVFGMPGKAIELAAADEVDTPTGIATRLNEPV